MSVRSIATSTGARLAQVVTAASRRPWAVLWIPLFIAWQMAARQVSVNRLEEALTLLLTIPELMGMVCIGALMLWQMWGLVKMAQRRRAGGAPQPPVYPWYGRIGLWFGAGFLLSAVLVP